MDNNIKEHFETLTKQMEKLSSGSMQNLENFQKLHPKTLPKKLRFGKTLMHKGYEANVCLSVGGAMIVTFDDPMDAERFFNSLK